MMKNSLLLKKVTSAAVFLLLTAALSFSAFADPLIDMGAAGSISVKMYDETLEEAIKGGTLTLFKVADVADDNGDSVFVFTEDFADCGIDISDPENSEARDALVAYAEEKALTGETVTIDDNGYAEFPDLPLGLYLVKQDKAASGYYEANPFLVSVPLFENGAYVYAVDASPKTEAERKPASSSSGTTVSGGSSHTSSSVTAPVSEPVTPNTVTELFNDEITEEEGNLQTGMPQTGDTYVALFAVLVMLASGFTMVYILNRRKRI